jgi:pimeloyl-ACP methyl ester carboxylesterase
VETISANGVNFAYLTEGQGPLVLLLHGFPDTAHTWDRSMKELAAAGFRVVAPFMRGYAPSEIPANGDYEVDTLGRDVLALIDALGEKQAIVVGHDWGAAAAYSAAGQGPEKISLLVTVAIPHPASLKPSPLLLLKQRHFLVLRRKKAGAVVRANNFAYVDELWHRWSPAWKSVPASETAPVKKAFAEPGCAEAAAAYYQFVGFRPPKSYLAKVQMPAVAFAGEHDVIPTRAYEKARHRYAKSYEVVIVPGGHFMHREHPDVFVPELVRVVTDHAKR